VPKAAVDGAELWYEFTGSGPLLVQIGGAVNAHEGYLTVTPAMAEHFTVLDYDHRGYGQSDRPDGQTYGLDVWASDLAALLDALEIEKLHVHGGSMGGFIATRFAARYPERVDRLVIGGAVAKCDRMSRTHFYIWKRLAQAYGVDSEELALHLTTHAFSRDFLESLGDSAVHAMRDGAARNVTLEVFLAACDLMITADTRDELDRITAPTLVMVGDEDVITPLDAAPGGAGARYMAEHIPHAELCVFEGCGHGNLVERADESITAITEFLRRDDARSPAGAGAD
jgi:pimeloyl-ACP methyl ester carboxylesterase